MKTSLYYSTIWEERQFIFLLYLHSHLQETKEFLFSLWSGRWNELFFDSLMTQRESYNYVVLLLVAALVNNLKNHLTPRHTKLKLIATLSKKVQQFNHRHTRYMPAQLCWENCSANLMILGSLLSQSLFYYTLLRGQEICGFNFNKAGFVFNGAVSRKQN